MADLPAEAVGVGEVAGVATPLALLGLCDVLGAGRAGLLEDAVDSTRAQTRTLALARAPFALTPLVDEVAAEAGLAIRARAEGDRCFVELAPV